MGDDGTCEPFAGCSCLGLDGRHGVGAERHTLERRLRGREPGRSVEGHVQQLDRGRHGNRYRRRHGVLQYQLRQQHIRRRRADRRQLPIQAAGVGHRSRFGPVGRRKPQPDVDLCGRSASRGQLCFFRQAQPQRFHHDRAANRLRGHSVDALRDRGCHSRPWITRQHSELHPHGRHQAHGRVRRREELCIHRLGGRAAARNGG